MFWGIPEDPVNRECHRAETIAQQDQRITQQGQKMEAAGRQSVLPCRLHERSIVEALAGLLTLDLSVLHFEPTQVG